MKKTPVFYCGEVNSQGGSKKSLLNILMLLKKNELDFKVVVGDEGWFTEVLIQNGIEYTLIKEHNRIKEIHKQNKKINAKVAITIIKLSIPVIIKNWIRVIKELKYIEKNIIFNEKRDLILFFPYLFIKTEKTLWLRAEKIDKLTSKLISRVDNVISVSNNTKKNVNFKEQNKVSVIYNFLETSFESEYRMNIANRITIAGSIQPMKGQKDAIKVMSLLSAEYTLNIVGRVVDQSYYKDLLKLIEKHKLQERVFFTGSKNKFIDYLNKNTDIVIMPSATEGFGRVAMEAMSLGIPVVAYDVGGLPEVVVNQKTGLLLEYKNIKGLAVAIHNITEDKKKYQNMSRMSSLVFEEKFSGKAVLEKLNQVLY